MKIKKCPYCGKRIPYTAVFTSRRKAEYVCERCGKESKVVIDKKVIFFFLLAAIISVAVMAAWIFFGLADNILGVLLVAVPLIIFAVFSTSFVKFSPLKKYRKSMEARKAGIEYSDNLLASEFEEVDNFNMNKEPEEQNSGFSINTNVFNELKNERNAYREKLTNGDLTSNSSKINTDVSDEKTDDTSKDKGYVHVIGDVSENHSISDAPLKKIHSETVRPVTRSRHYVPRQNREEEQKKPDGNRYSANRRF